MSLAVPGVLEATLGCPLWLKDVSKHRPVSLNLDVRIAADGTTEPSRQMRWVRGTWARRAVTTFTRGLGFVPGGLGPGHGLNRALPGRADGTHWRVAQVSEEADGTATPTAGPVGRARGMTCGGGWETGDVSCGGCQPASRRPPGRGPSGRPQALRAVT